MKHLTVVDPILESQIAKTPPGMAFWSGTGPERTTCRTCVFYTFEGYMSYRSNKGGMLKRGACKEFIRLVNKASHKLPHDIPSCKYYQENKTPPAIMDPGK